MSVDKCLLVLMKTLNLYVNCTLSDESETRLHAALQTLSRLGLVCLEVPQTQSIDVQVLTWDRVQELDESQRCGNIWIVQDGDFVCRLDQIFPNGHDLRIRFVQVQVRNEYELLGLLTLCVANYDVALE